MGQLNKTTPPGRLGARLADGAAHAYDHGRRGFLRTLGLVGASGFLLNRLPVSAVGMSPLASALAEGDDDRVLVMIRLKGGNDGLNTFIPVHDFGRYQELRPDVHIPRNEAIDLTPTLSMHPQLAPLTTLWNDGQMRVVQNTGYPSQSLSHFRSSDIWASTSDADENVRSGVLGRYLTGQYPDFLSTPPPVPPAIQIGGPGNLLFNNEEDFNYAISTENPRQLYDIARTGQLYDVNDVPDCTYGEQLQYLRAVANTTFRYAGVLAEAFDAGQNSVEYKNDRLGDQLALVARLLRGGIGTRFFVVEIDGFDTHANQADDHAYLMDSLSTNTAAFFADLEAGGIEERVLGMTFSEFGRRVFQNGSRGTDHGAAAPLMLFGKGLNGNGVTGGLPDLANAQHGNLSYEVDFRSIYATVLTNWLCIDGAVVDEIMGGSFARVEELGLACQGTVSSQDPLAQSIGMRAYLTGNEVKIDYELPAAATVGVHFFDMSGRKLSSPFRGQQRGGAQQLSFPLDHINWAAGVHVVSLEVNGRMYSRKLSLFR